jgi:hypothetical protein
MVGKIENNVKCVSIQQKVVFRIEDYYELSIKSKTGLAVFLT